MKNITATLLTAAMVLSGAVGVLAMQPSTAYAAVDPSDSVKQGIKDAGGGGAKKNNLPDLIQGVINLLLFVIGVVSVVMIVIGGIKYTLSNGDSTQVTSAKNTVLYSVVGLVVALLAYAIVNFVVDKF